MNETSKVAHEAALEVEFWLKERPGTTNVINVEDDSIYRERDIDLIWVSNGKTRTVEIKGDRYFNTGNYFFETVSNESKGTPGCFLYSEADYLFYYFIEVKELHILALTLVRNWFKLNLQQFTEKRLSTSVNGSFYNTVGYTVPRWFVKQELPQCVRIFQLQGCLMICEASKKKLTIMFDLHGVANKRPDFIKPMMKTFRACGHKVIICSGPTISIILDELNELGYESGHHYDDVISVVDYLAGVRGVKFTYDKRGNPWCEPKVWFQSKGFIAFDNGVDVVIDDSPEYEEHMPKGTAFWLWRENVSSQERKR